MKKLIFTVTTLIATTVLLSQCDYTSIKTGSYDSSPVELVNPYMGNIQHMLVPTYPTVHLPNQMLRFYPDRENFTSTQMSIPLIQTSHRGTFAFHISPINRVLTDSIPNIIKYYYDQEEITPYSYKVFLENESCNLEFSLSNQSGLFILDFDNLNSNIGFILHTDKGQLQSSGNIITGYQQLQDSTKCYLYMETNKAPDVNYVRQGSSFKQVNSDSIEATTVALSFLQNTSKLKIRYGISFISIQQAKENLYKQIQTYEIKLIKEEAKSIWNNSLGKISIEGGSPDQQTAFYTSLYRVYERMVNISENGKYYSAYDNTVHNDDGISFYVDDWVWDTYRATHPLRIIIDPKVHHDILCSYIRMAEQSNPNWLPSFPEVTGDTHRMNGSHAISLFIDAAIKGMGDINYNKAYEYGKNTMENKSYIPWTKFPKSSLSKFMDKNGYFPALKPGEKETDSNVTEWEKRQAVAVTLAASFDYWSLAKLSRFTGHESDFDKYNSLSKMYMNVFNTKTNFFHPKDITGKFIEPFSYELSGGLGGRDYYDENNGYTYRFDLQQNPHELIRLMGGKSNFIQALDETFNTPLSIVRFNFLHQFPDQTANVGQFTMANEPSLHIPYLYNYAGQPWRTQKMVRKLLDEWFRNDYMGVPGDEDGGGMSAFVVFSMIGIYPVTPGLPYYNISSPIFTKSVIKLQDGNTFTISAPNTSKENKYIQSAKLNGKKINRCYIRHKEIMDGGELYLEMGNKPNKSWGLDSIPEY